MKFVRNWGQLGMKFEWQTKKIGDVVDIRRGSSPRPIHKFLATEGMPWVKIADATSDTSRYIWKTNEFIIEDGVTKSVKVAPETLIVSNSATPGLPKIMKITACVHDGWLVFSNYRGITRDFLYYKFIDIRRTLVNQANGSVFQNLKTDIVKEFDIRIPCIETQKKIVGILSQIDEKIELNNAINNNLVQQAQAIFKSWFVDFDPFGGNRPIDWITGIVDDLGAEIICGKTPSTKKKEYYGGNTPFITIPDMHGCVYNVSTERYLSAAGVASQPKKTLPHNTVCISCIGTAGLVTLVSEKSQSNQQINSIIPKEGISAYYIYLLMQTLSETINKLGQSGSTIVNLNKTQFGKIPVTIPSEQVLCNFDTLCKPLFEMILSNQKENIKLANLRDTLLPKLMSGELDVSDIDL